MQLVDYPINEFEILRFLVKSREYYEKYYDLVEKYITSRDLKTIYSAVDYYYKTCLDHTYIEQEELQFFIKNNYPQLRNLEAMEMIIEGIYEIHVSTNSIKTYIHLLLETSLYQEVAELCQDALYTRHYDKVDLLEQKFATYRAALKHKDESPFAEFDFDKFVEDTKAEGGFNWRLKCLNESCGPLPPETLSHIFARPNGGKTSFLASEITHFASQLAPGEVILWINNEQAIGKVWERCIASIIRAPYAIAEARPDEAKEFLNKKNFNQIKFIDGAYVSLEYISALAKEYNPRIIVIDQGDKIHFKGDKDQEGHARLKELYRRLRELAKDSKAAIITVGQASAEGEGKKWITMDMMDNSKVGKPGEMDLIIGIGQSAREDEQNLRFINIAKNKLKGLHTKTAVVFDAEKARYLDMG